MDSAAWDAVRSGNDGCSGCIPGLLKTIGWLVLVMFIVALLGEIFGSIGL